MKNRLTRRFLFAAAAVLALATPAGAGERPRMVLELFTSQGCSSCPAADKLMGDLAKRPDMLVLSLPVDYWDYLGWRDTLAEAAFTARQRGYGKVRGDRQVYTPQVVIDGETHAVGSEWNSIEAAAKEVTADALSVPVSIAGSREKPAVEVGAATGAARSGTVWLLPLSHSRTVAIGRGENSGRTVIYTNVVRGIVRLGEWTGEAAHFDLPAAALATDQADGYAVLLQAGTDRRPGTILGAARSPSAAF